MKKEKENTSNFKPEDKISKEIQSILITKNDLEKQLDSEKKLYDIHFNKQWALEKGLDKVLGTAKEKNVKK